MNTEVRAAMFSLTSRCIEALDARYMLILQERALGRTLKEVGAKLAVTRERVRQLEKSASEALTALLDPVPAAVVREALGAMACVKDEELIHPDLPGPQQLAVLISLGAVRPKVIDSRRYSSGWTLDPDWLAREVATIVRYAPFLAAAVEPDWTERTGTSVLELVSIPGFPLAPAESVSGYVRRASPRSDEIISIPFASW